MGCCAARAVLGIYEEEGEQERREEYGCDKYLGLLVERFDTCAEPSLWMAYSGEQRFWLVPLCESRRQSGRGQWCCCELCEFIIMMLLVPTACSWR